MKFALKQMLQNIIETAARSKYSPNRAGRSRTNVGKRTERRRRVCLQIRVKRRGRYQDDRKSISLKYFYRSPDMQASVLALVCRIAKEVSRNTNDARFQTLKTRPTGLNRGIIFPKRTLLKNRYPKPKGARTMTRSMGMFTCFFVWGLFTLSAPCVLP